MPQFVFGASATVWQRDSSPLTRCAQGPDQIHGRASLEAAQNWRCPSLRPPSLLNALLSEFADGDPDSELVIPRSPPSDP